MLMPLDMLCAGTWAEVEEVSGQADWVGRLAELGIRQGCRLQVVQPGATCLLDVSGCKLCLRGADSSQILVRPVVA
ncbi:MAG: ferrous iron transport protein A [Gemmataceae bacterium]|nr:ferrous iron transport protein A [Gemmataceae bacterium]